MAWATSGNFTSRISPPRSRTVCECRSHRGDCGRVDTRGVPGVIDADTQAVQSARHAGEIIRHRVRHRSGVVADRLPAMAPSIAPQSAALRAIGPMWSSVAASSNTP